MLPRVLRIRNTNEDAMRRHWFVDLLTLTTITFAASVGLFASDYFTRLTMVAGVLACMLIWRHVFDALVVFSCTVVVLGAVLGWGLSFYDRIWWYDDLAHFSFSLIGVMAVARLLLHKFRAESAFLLLAALWFCWLGIGSLWEIGEWVSDRLEGTNHSRGYLDTMVDMMLNSVGSAIGVWMYWSWFRTPVDQLVIQDFRHQTTASE